MDVPSVKGVPTLNMVIIVAIVAISIPAHADIFVELVGGLTLPTSDDEWTSSMVTHSPKLGARIGSDELGGMLAVDWTPEAFGNPGYGGLGIGEGDGSLQRLRAIASAVFHHRVAPAVTVSGRTRVAVMSDRADIRWCDSWS